MILNNAPQAEAVLSNVGEIGEFRIRNSAKAFNILSSGLYANKIKAIVRELSCNAVDSHIAAGNTTPFEVHLPTNLEPYFYIRDFGTGLSHEQVTSIYTTYFESTKTGSNDFIGALGLGSKSPFSYTDNFTVTAIKDGRKGIYTAFINDAGVPSIALMTEEQTTEPAGVEVRFAVASSMDFLKFQSEAKSVYKHFKQKPVIIGAKVDIQDKVYETKDVIPGVHYTQDHQRSIAIMGNIAYPIEANNLGTGLGDLGKLLSCGLEMHFDIGELDFQASREGLSYIPQTIDAIRNKLQKLNDALTGVLAKEADAITNLWKRSIFLYEKKRHSLWSNAVTSYASSTNFKYYDTNKQYHSRFDIAIDSEVLESRFNLKVRAFQKRVHEKTCGNIGSNMRREEKVDATGQKNIVHIPYWEFPVDDATVFVKNDTKVGASERAKFHWRSMKDQKQTNTVFVLEPADRNQPALFGAFLKFIGNPPAEQAMFASTLEEKPRNGGIGKNVSILYLEEKTRRGSWRDSKYVTWTATKFGDLDPNATYYYLPLSGYNVQSNLLPSYISATALREKLIDSGIPELKVTVYGVRKGDIEQIKQLKNWINLEDYIVKTLSNIPQSTIDGMCKTTVEKNTVLAYTKNFYNKFDDKNPIKLMHQRFSQAKSVAVRPSVVNELCGYFAKNTTFDPSVLLAKVEKECNNIVSRYPLLNMLNSYVRATDNSAVIEYVNLIDKTKGF